MAGTLSAGDALPSMRLLAKELRISVITTKRAYEELERDGFLENVPGKGCFVAPQNRELLREAQLRRVEEKLFQAVEEGGYDGLFLDVTGLTAVSQRDTLTAAAQTLREKLGERSLYIAVEAPSWKGTIFGYDYAALGEAADRLVLRFDYKKTTAGGQAMAPMEPLEQIYYALNRLRGVVDADKLTLRLTSTGSIWEGREPEFLTGEEIAALAAERTTRSHYSDRYACAYLVRENAPDVWYLNGQAIRERIQLARLFGGGHLCLSDLNHTLPEVLEAMP